MTGTIPDKNKRILEFLKNNPNAEIYKIMLGANIPTKKETIKLVNDLRKLKFINAEFKNKKHYFSINKPHLKVKKIN